MLFPVQGKTWTAARSICLATVLLSHLLLFLPSYPESLAPKTSPDIMLADILSDEAPQQIAPAIADASPASASLAEQQEAQASEPAPLLSTTPSPAPRAEPLSPAQATEGDQAMFRNLGAYYFSRQELDQAPRLLENVSNELSIAIPGIDGQILVLQLMINEDGAMDRVEVQKSSLNREQAQQVALHFMRLRFTPGRVDGMDVKSKMLIEVQLLNAGPSMNSLAGKGAPAANDAPAEAKQD
ncbi:hypothetical protein V8J88_04585 [Massilia sp. W12]|uniref:energy transducer TonB n=1 Tax=Massilia sp. W12 TaxID=3126507 RepID=UPI0030D4CE4A